VDALQVEVVGRDVREHARVVRLVADAAQDDPAARGLEDRDVDVAPARTIGAPPGPVQSPASTIRSSTRTPSEVVVPTCRPASSRMWVISRVTVLFPFVPEIDTIGVDRRVAQPFGGVFRAASIRSVQRATSRSCAPSAALGDRRYVALREGQRRLGQGLRPFGPGPREGHDPVPGSDERWTARPRRPSPWSARRRRIQATVAATGSGQSRAGTSAPSWTSAWRPGSRWPYHVRRRPTATRA
jgi:hypothetical protein